MDGTKRQLLAAAGIDVDDALDRFLDNDTLMIKFLLRFPQDGNFSRLRNAMAQSDAAGAFEAAHTFKGVVGNLSMQELFSQVSAMVEDLRRGDLRTAAERMPALEKAYGQILEALAQLA